MTDTDDVKRLSTREAELAEDVKRRDSDPTLGLTSILARTTAVRAYPTAPQCYYACQPLSLLGPEVEGGPGAITGGDSTFYALNLGSNVPPLGTTLLATFAGSRWVFRYDA